MNNIGTKRYSSIWKHFKAKDESNFIATCNICHNDYSFRTTITNLLKHLKSKHGQISDDDATDASDEWSNHSDEEHHTDKKPLDSKPNKKSTWQYFDVLDSDKFIAKCKRCNKEISYDSISELAQHVKEDHDEDISDDDMNSDNEKTLINLTKPKRLTSHVWRYMQLVDNKNAICRLCNKRLSYTMTVSNLKKHLLRKHPNVKLDVSEKTDKKVLIASDGQIFEVQTSDVEKDPIGTNEEYLESIDDDNSVHNFETVTTTSPPQENETYRKPEKITRKRKLPKEVHKSHSDSNFSDEDVPVKKKKYMNTLDIFGQYIISLLSQMPQHVSDQLQSDIIKQIFMAKVALNTPGNIVTYNEKPVSITVSNGTGNIMPEITVNNGDIVMDGRN